MKLGKSSKISFDGYIWKIIHRPLGDVLSVSIEYDLNSLVWVKTSLIIIRNTIKIDGIR